MRFLCNHCDARLSTEHYWEGLSVTCPNCGKATELKYRIGQSIPWTGYSMTFSDFKQLLTDPPYFEAVEPLIKELLGCSVERTETGLRLVDEDGSLIPFEAAHLAIQSNDDAQGRIYSVAMGLWR